MHFLKKFYTKIVSAVWQGDFWGIGRHVFYEKSLPLGGEGGAPRAPDEGEMSGSCPLISRLRRQLPPKGEASPLPRKKSAPGGALGGIGVGVLLVFAGKGGGGDAFGGVQRVIEQEPLVVGQAVERGFDALQGTGTRFHRAAVE